MKCPKCQRDNNPADLFCSHCGALLRKPSEYSLSIGPEALEAISRQLAQLKEETRSLRVISAAAAARLADLERRLGTRYQPAVQGDATSIKPLPEAPAREEPQPTSAGQAQPAATVSQPASGMGQPGAVPGLEGGKGFVSRLAMKDLQEEMAGGTTRRPPGSTGTTRAEWLSWERVLGGNWLARVGILAIIIGAIFFFKLAFDRGWIGPLGRVGLVLLGGLILLGLGQYWHKRYPAFAQTLSGGGVALVYAAAFVAFAPYRLVGFYPATALLFLISAGGVGIALAYDSMALAILGVVGALAAPLALGAFAPGEAGQTGGVQISAYLVIVDLGVLALAGFKRWPWFTLVALLGSLLAFLAWYGNYGAGREDVTALVGLSAIFLIFVGATSLYQFWRRKPFGDFDVGLVIANAVLYYLFGLAITVDKLGPWQGLFSFAVAAFYGGLAVLSLSGPESSRVRPYLASLALGFLTVAIPLQFRDGYWTTISWGIEGVVMLALFLWRRVRFLDLWAFVVLGLSNLWLATFGSHVAAMIVWALEGGTMVALSLRFRSVALRTYGFVVIGLMNLWLALFVDRPLVTVLWAGEAVAMVGLWPVVRLAALRYYGYGMFGATLLWLTFFVAPLGFGSFPLVLNERFLVFAVAIASMYLGAYLVWRGRAELGYDEQQMYSVYPILLGLANVFSLVALSLEVLSYFAGVVNGLFNGQQFNTEAPRLWNAASLILSFVWAGYAIVLLAIGIIRRSLPIRWAGLGLLGVVVAKLFVYDVFTLQLVYRIVAFVGLGVVLLVCGYLYQRYGKAIKGFLVEK